MGNISQTIPVAMVYLSIGRAGLPLHTKESAIAAGSPSGDKGLIMGVKVLAYTIVDLLTNSQLILQAKEENLMRKTEKLYKIWKESN